jgi:hypothetical protein
MSVVKVKFIIASAAAVGIATSIIPDIGFEGFSFFAFKFCRHILV